MSDLILVVGAFADEEETVKAIHEIRRAGLSAPRVFAPIPSEKILEALELHRSPLRWVVLVGGALGIISGFALTIGTSLYWPHYVGGKPLISLPPFIIIAFELMILFGALLGLTTFFILGRFPRLKSEPGFSSRFSSDRFGVAVKCADAQSGKVENLLRDAGAEEIVRETA